jgi:hypothetical protein
MFKSISNILAHLTETDRLYHKIGIYYESTQPDEYWMFQYEFISRENYTELTQKN